MTKLKAPVAKRIKKIFEEHGNQRVDYYHWMRDDERKNPEVIKHLQEENDYKETCLQEFKDEKQKILAEIHSRIQDSYDTLKCCIQGYWYWCRYQKGLEYPQILRTKEQEKSSEEIIMDENERAGNSTFYDLGQYSISPCNDWMAFSEDKIGRREYRLNLKNLKDGSIKSLSYHRVADFEWITSSCILFIVKHPETLRPFQVYRSFPFEDCAPELLYEEQDEAYYLDLELTDCKSYILLNSTSTSTSEVRFIERKHQASFQLFCSREQDHEYYLDHHNGNCYIRSNHKVKNFAIYKVSSLAQGMDKNNWQLLLQEDQNVLIEDFMLKSNYLVLEQRCDGISRLVVYHLASKKRRELSMPSKASTSKLSMQSEDSSSSLRFRYCYESLQQPETIYEEDLDSGETRVLKIRNVNGYDHTKYEAQHFSIEVRDGVKVPVSLVYHKDLFVLGQNPMLVYGYGAYGLIIDPEFDQARISLLDRGFVYAIAHVRGSEFMGREWYEAGKLKCKMNSFYDFIDVTEGLINRGYADADKVFAQGGSAGGLLVGAVMNFRPDLYKAVVAEVPFVDVITTMMDKDLPLTVGEYEEWGNPEDESYYKYILQYSPYDQVKSQNYPHVLATLGLHDSQVQYFEPLKWVQKLRHYNTSPNKILLHCDLEAGHGGKSGRYRYFEDVALAYSFVHGTLKGIRGKN